RRCSVRVNAVIDDDFRASKQARYRPSGAAHAPSILLRPCLLEKARHSLLKLDNPMVVVVEDLRPRGLQLRMRLQHLLQHRFLFVLEIYAQDVLIVFYGLFKTGKVVVGLLDTEQAALPRAKTENHDCKENKRHPAGGGLRPAGKMGDD